VTGSVISDPDAQAAIWFLGALSQAAARHGITILAPPPQP
jgi:hypothetical protein